MLSYLVVCVIAVLGVWLMHDLARRRAEAERLRRLLEPYARLGEGIEGVSHDARNLLRATRFSLEALAVSPDAGEQARGLAERADQQLREAESFLQAVGTRPGDLQDVDAVAVLRLVVALHEGRRSVDAGALSGELPVRARPDELSRLLSNLVTNALDHGGEVTVRREERSLVVANPLSGPPPGPEIYERGRSTKGRGRGLGLYWSREFAGRMGARLSHDVHAADGGDGRAWIRFALAFDAPGREGDGG